MDSARLAYCLDDYFSLYVIGEDHDYKDKHKILKQMNLGPFIMVGDRENDIEAGYKNGMQTIFAKYGYGSIKEATKADYIIDDIRDIKNII